MGGAYRRGGASHLPRAGGVVSRPLVWGAEPPAGPLLEGRGVANGRCRGNRDRGRGAGPRCRSRVPIGARPAVTGGRGRGHTRRRRRSAMAAGVEDGLGTVCWWGLSPALDLRQHREPGDPPSSRCPPPRCPPGPHPVTPPPPVRSPPGPRPRGGGGGAAGGRGGGAASPADRVPGPAGTPPYHHRTAPAPRGDGELRSAAGSRFWGRNRGPGSYRGSGGVTGGACRVLPGGGRGVPVLPGGCPGCYRVSPSRWGVSVLGQISGSRCSGAG